MNYAPKDSVIIVTGGAGQLGSALCKELDSLGNTVYMSDISSSVADERIRELGLRTTYPLELDVTSQESIDHAFDKVMKKHGKIDVLVNNAGIAVFTPFQQRTFEEFDKVMKVNVYGTFFCSKKALSIMEKQDSGVIVNIGSIYGVVSADPRIYGDSGRNSSEVYAASKAGIIQMTKYLACHIKSSKIRINSVSPGGIFNNQKEFFVKNYCNKTPMARMADPKDIVSVIVFLCSDGSSYMSGENVMVDGGFSKW